MMDDNQPNSDMKGKDFDQLLKELKSIERKANTYAWKLKNPQHSEKLWYDMHPIWNSLMDEIQTRFPKKWKQHCEENNLVTNYNFGDVLA